ncbi:MAG: sigma-70 domain-containing protein [Eubacteriales bacterium]|jgi:RNA polymerase primary sigma factor
MKEARKLGLTEEFMPEVEELAKEVSDGTVPMEDLIQEGYVGLMEGIAELDQEGGSGDEDDFGTFSGYDDGGLSTEEVMRGAIRKALERAQKEAAALKKKDDRVIVQVEMLNESISKLTEELGKKPNIDEIANDLRIPQEKVLDILKLTGEDIDAEDRAANAVPEDEKDTDSGSH